MNEILEFENNKVGYKSLKKVFGKNADLKSLTKKVVEVTIQKYENVAIKEKICHI